MFALTFHYLLVDINKMENLLQIYAAQFGEKNHDFFRTHIDLTVDSWIGDLKDLIDENTQQQITYEVNDREKIIKVVRYLEKADDIRKYKKFISIWKTKAPAVARRFEGGIQILIKNADLLAIDALYSSAPTTKPAS